MEAPAGMLAAMSNATKPRMAPGPTWPVLPAKITEPAPLPTAPAASVISELSLDADKVAVSAKLSEDIAIKTARQPIAERRETFMVRILKLEKPDDLRRANRRIPTKTMLATIGS
jgi:hypothetical protein